MDKQIQVCFRLYFNYMKSQIKHLHELDIESMSVVDIKGQLEIVYMQYIIASNYSISETSPYTVGYKQLKNMISESNSNLSIENANLKRELKSLKATMMDTLVPSVENVSESIASEEQPKQKAGWFFSN
jgi:hypothetical protein